ncbi:efflux RND transporter periplasmic adaptor subunit, partial [Puniceibacterium confluentis]|uniref:efflux RND transporter periplasmic adaptor subunit n=1 Tax=Puniceibacterium confluentis TaxID=1958944 RepID=UPI0035645B83
PDPVPVDLHTVSSGPLQVSIDIDGRTRVRELYEIAAPIAGVARRSPVAVGDPVIGGETVVAIVDPVAPGLLDVRSRLQADAQVSEAEAALHVAETDLRRAVEERTHAQSRFDRARTLVERGVSSISQLEDATQRLAVADATVEAAHARIDMARGALERARAELIEPDMTETGNGACCVPLLAPADGVVLSVDVISARPVTAGTRLATVGDLRDLEIVAELLSSEAVRLAPGARAIVERWGGDAPLAAQLRRIEPKARTAVSALGIEEQRVVAVFDLTSAPAGHADLGDGFSVFLRIIEWEAEDALQIPLSATFRAGEGWAVFIVRDDIAHQRAVSLGRSAARTVQVLDGLVAGESVVTHPSDDLEDGVRVVQR